MFTGIIQNIGTVAEIVKQGDWVLTIKTGLPLAATPIGASIACSGACLTVISKTADTFTVQASHETIDVTTIKHWSVGTRVNLEPALRMGDELGGHLVSGHVDGIAKLFSRAADSDSVRLIFDAPEAFQRFIAPKGSVVIDGVSLTVNEADGARFGINIIPHTQTATTLGALQAGDEVNFEVDLIARYLDRLIQRP
jgi:riboflavin synthase